VNAREAYIALNMIPGVGPVGVRSLVSVLGGPEAIFEAGADDLRRAPGVGRELAAQILNQRDKIDVSREVGQAEQLGARLVTQVDAEYPKPLLAIHDPPLALYVAGTLESRDEHAIAVVGSRRTTHYGSETAERLACQLAQSGFTVVSGLARGIDTAAHRGALKGHGRTLAVLGGGMNCLFPPENAELAKAIVAQGAVITEYPLGREPDKTTFPYRNRIVSGLSLGVVVVEAGVTSGAMITAGQAAEQGRTVFAVPGRVDSIGSQGPHRLIKDGARLVETVEDILQEYDQLIPQTPQAAQGSAAAPRFSEDEARVLALLEDEKELDVDSLIRQTGLGAAAISSLLIGLEMKRAVKMVPGHRVVLRQK
jgi:DNA processing protein